MTISIQIEGSTKLELVSLLETFKDAGLHYGHRHRRSGESEMQNARMIYLERSIQCLVASQTSLLRIEQMPGLAKEASRTVALDFHPMKMHLKITGVKAVGEAGKHSSRAVQGAH